MHEFSICDRIVEAVLDELDRLGPPVPRLHKTRVVVGRLHQVVPEYLAFAYETLTRETVAEGSVLEVAQVPVRARCRACAWAGEIETPFFRCGACCSLDVEMTGGKELYLEHLEVDSTDDAASGSRSAASRLAGAPQS